MEVRQYDFSKLFGLIVNSRERINTTKKNVILIFQCSKCSDSLHISFYFVIKKLIIMKNSVAKIQNLVMNHKSQPSKSKPSM